MRRTGRVLFVVTYIAASIAVTGYRSAWMAERVLHAAKPTHIELNAPAESYVKAPWPYFAHARKVKSQAVETPDPTVCIPQFTVKYLAERPALPLSSRLESAWVGTRAPPALT